MSGFAVHLDTDAPAEASKGVFQSFLDLTAGYKELSLPAQQASGQRCHAAKLDTPSSLHTGIVKDDTTGSWLLAAGSVIETTGQNSQDPNLSYLLKDFVNHGYEALQRYDGGFALVIYDGRDGSLSVISDPVGLYSIFYGARGNQTFISSSALAVAKQIRAKPDLIGVEGFLRTGLVFGSTTLWSGVKRLMPASVLRFIDGQVEEFEYWEPTIDDAVASLPFDDALIQASEMLSDSFELSLRREGKVWSDLTGGFDTRMATTIASGINIPFIANCVGPNGNPDVMIADEISKELGWEFVHLTLPEDWAERQQSWFESALHKGDGHLNAVQLAGVLWGQQQRATTSQVTITGLGGELWRGAYWRQELFNIGKSSTVNYDRFIDFKILRPPMPVSLMREDRVSGLRQDLRNQLLSVTAGYKDHPNTTQLDRILIWTYTNWEGAFLSAAAGVQRYLHPLCLKAPTTFAFSLPDAWKHPVYQRFARYLLEKENQKLAGIRTTHGGPALPIRMTNVHQFWPFWRSVIARVVAKFSQKALRQPIVLWPAASRYPSYPLPDWKQGWLDYARAERLLDPSEMRSGELYNAAELKKLVSQVEAGNSNAEEFLPRIMTVEMALRSVETDVDLN